VTKRANNGRRTVLNFDPCDLQKVKSITRVLGHVSSLDIPMIKITQPLVQELQHFLCFQFWPAGGQTKNQTAPKFGVSGQ
jgi:hypothetical protein